MLIIIFNKHQEVKGSLITHKCMQMFPIINIIRFCLNIDFIFTMQMQMEILKKIFFLINVRRIYLRTNKY